MRNPKETVIGFQDEELLAIIEQMQLENYEDEEIEAVVMQHEEGKQNGSQDKGAAGEPTVDPVPQDTEPEPEATSILKEEVEESTSELIKPEKEVNVVGGTATVGGVSTPEIPIQEQEVDIQQFYSTKPQQDELTSTAGEKVSRRKINKQRKKKIKEQETTFFDLLSEGEYMQAIKSSLDTDFVKKELGKALDKAEGDNPTQAKILKALDKMQREEEAAKTGEEVRKTQAQLNTEEARDDELRVRAQGYGQLLGAGSVRVRYEDVIVRGEERTMVYRDPESSDTAWMPGERNLMSRDEYDIFVKENKAWFEENDPDGAIRFAARRQIEGSQWLEDDTVASGTVTDKDRLAGFGAISLDWPTSIISRSDAVVSRYFNAGGGETGLLNGINSFKAGYGTGNAVVVVMPNGEQRYIDLKPLGSNIGQMDWHRLDINQMNGINTVNEIRRDMKVFQDDKKSSLGIWHILGARSDAGLRLKTSNNWEQSQQGFSDETEVNNYLAPLGYRVEGGSKDLVTGSTGYSLLRYDIGEDGEFTGEGMPVVIENPLYGKPMNGEYGAGTIQNYLYNNLTDSEINVLAERDLKYTTNQLKALEYKKDLYMSYFKGKGVNEGETDEEYEARFGGLLADDEYRMWSDGKAKSSFKFMLENTGMSKEGLEIFMQWFDSSLQYESGYDDYGEMVYRDIPVSQQSHWDFLRSQVDVFGGMFGKNQWEQFMSFNAPTSYTERDEIGGGSDETRRRNSRGEDRSYFNRGDVAQTALAFNLNEEDAKALTNTLMGWDQIVGEEKVLQARDSYFYDWYGPYVGEWIDNSPNSGAIRAGLNQATSNSNIEEKEDLIEQKFQVITAGIDKTIAEQTDLATNLFNEMSEAGFTWEWRGTGEGRHCVVFGDNKKQVKKFQKRANNYITSLNTVENQLNKGVEAYRSELAVFQDEANGFRFLAGEAEKEYDFGDRMSQTWWGAWRSIIEGPLALTPDATTAFNVSEGVDISASMQDVDYDTAEGTVQGILGQLPNFGLQVVTGGASNGASLATALYFGAQAGGETNANIQSSIWAAETAQLQLDSLEKLHESGVITFDQYMSEKMSLQKQIHLGNIDWQSRISAVGLTMSTEAGITYAYGTIPNARMWRGLRAKTPSYGRFVTEGNLAFRLRYGINLAKGTAGEAFEEGSINLATNLINKTLLNQEDLDITQGLDETLYISTIMGFGSNVVGVGRAYISEAGMRTEFREATMSTLDEIQRLYDDLAALDDPDNTASYGAQSKYREDIERAIEQKYKDLGDLSFELGIEARILGAKGAEDILRYNLDLSQIYNEVGGEMTDKPSDLDKKVRDKIQELRDKGQNDQADGLEARYESTLKGIETVRKVGDDKYKGKNPLEEGGMIFDLFGEGGVEIANDLSGKVEGWDGLTDRQKAAQVSMQIDQNAVSERVDDIMERDEDNNETRDKGRVLRFIYGNDQVHFNEETGTWDIYKKKGLKLNEDGTVKEGELRKTRKTNKEKEAARVLAEATVVNRGFAIVSDARGQRGLRSIISNENIDLTEDNIEDFETTEDVEKHIDDNYRDWGWDTTKRDAAKASVRSGATKAFIVQPKDGSKPQYIVMDKERAKKAIQRGDLLQGTAILHEVGHALDRLAMKEGELSRGAENLHKSLISDDMLINIHSAAVSDLEALGIENAGRYDSSKSFKDQSDKTKDEYTKRVLELLADGSKDSRYRGRATKLGKAGMMNNFRRVMGGDYTFKSKNSFLHYLMTYLDEMESGSQELTLVERKARAKTETAASTTAAVEGADVSQSQDGFAEESIVEDLGLKAETKKIVKVNEDIYTNIAAKAESEGVPISKDLVNQGMKDKLVENNLPRAFALAKRAANVGRNLTLDEGLKLDNVREWFSEYSLKLVELANTWNPAINDSFGAYMNGLLPKKYSGILKNLKSKVEGTSMDTNEATKRQAEAIKDKPDTKKKERKGKGVVLKDRIGEVGQKIHDNIKRGVRNGAVETEGKDFSTLGNAAPAQTQQMFGIDPKPGNLTQPDVENAQREMQRWDIGTWKAILPNHHTTKIVTDPKTGEDVVRPDQAVIPRSALLRPEAGLYRKGTRKDNITPYYPEDFDLEKVREVFGITPVGQPNLFDRQIQQRVRAGVDLTGRLLTAQAVQEGKREMSNELATEAENIIQEGNKEAKKLRDSGKIEEASATQQRARSEAKVKLNESRQALTDAVTIDNGKSEVAFSQAANEMVRKFPAEGGRVIDKIQQEFSNKLKNNNYNVEKTMDEIFNEDWYSEIAQDEDWSLSEKRTRAKIKKIKGDVSKLYDRYAPAIDMDKRMGIIGKPIEDIITGHIVDESTTHRQYYKTIVGETLGLDEPLLSVANDADYRGTMRERTKDLASRLTSKFGDGFVERFLIPGLTASYSAKRGYFYTDKGFSTIEAVRKDLGTVKGETGKYSKPPSDYMKGALNSDGINKVRKNQDATVKAQQENNVAFRQIVEEMKSMYMTGKLSASEVVTILEVMNANQKGLTRSSAVLDFLPTQPFNGKSTLEHMTPALQVNLQALRHILGTDTQQKAAFDSMMDNYRLAYLPKKYDDIVNDFYKSKMPYWWSSDMSPLARYYGPELIGAGFDLELEMLSTGYKIGGDVGVSPRVWAKVQGSRLEALGEIGKGATPTEIAEMRKMQQKAIVSFSQGASNKGMTAWDFDDTLARTKSNVLFTAPDSTTGSLTAEDFAKRGSDLLAQGYVFDFSEFNKVTGGTPGPFLDKALKKAKKFGTEDTFILTARSPESAPAIKEFLDAQGLNIPIENIVGLGNSTGAAKGRWILGKIGEGYNDVYFADDAMQNVKAVQQVIDQYDVKGKAQQARVLFSQQQEQTFSDIIGEGLADLDSDFDIMLEESKGVGRQKIFSPAKARQRGKNKGRFKFFIPPSADDFAGLMYSFMGKGEQGNKHHAWFKKNLFDPFSKGIRRFNSMQQEVSTDLRTLKKGHKAVRKNLKKTVPGTDFTYEQAIRVYGWAEAGYDMPGLSQTDQVKLVKAVESDTGLKAFADSYKQIVEKGAVEMKPSNSWLAGTLSSDLSESIDSSRESYMTEWNQNIDAIFSDKNLNKIEAVYGTRFREALEDIMFRMKTGSHRNKGGDRLMNNFMKWVHGSIGTTMFFNARSAMLQMISNVNFVNWSDNNPLAAAKAFANQPQYWSDVAMIFNSPFLKQRRSGIGTDLNAAELLKELKGAKKPMQTAVAHLLQLGFTPTQIADSLAISTGGATMYRNRVNTYVSENMSNSKAEEKAFEDMMEIAEETQQSARPDKISQQQASPLGKVILAFQNTPMQYNRLIKKAAMDLVNGRGDYKTNISKIVYYGTVQNMIFYGLQSAMFSALFGDDEEEDIEKKQQWALNGMIDTLLRGSGIAGAVVATSKNTILEFMEQEKKSDDGKFYTEPDHAYTVLEALNLSPPIGIKARKLYSGLQTWEFNRDIIDHMDNTDIDNPMWDAVFSGTEALTNIPLSRLYNKTMNVKEALNSDHETWKRVAMLLGWSRWSFGIKNSDVMSAKGEVKEIKAEEAEQRREEKKIQKEAETKAENEAVIEEHTQDQQEKRDQGVDEKDITCAAVNKSGNRCGKKVLAGQTYCTIHEEVDQRADGEKKQCTHVKASGDRCKMQTSNQSGKCYYHD